MLICVRREDGEELVSACTTGGLTPQQEWEWYKQWALPLVEHPKSQEDLAPAALPPLFQTASDPPAVHPLVLDRVINGAVLRRIQPRIVGPGLPPSVQVFPELTNMLMPHEPGDVSSSFRRGVRLGFGSTAGALFVDQWLQLVLPALGLGAGQELSVAVLNLDGYLLHGTARMTAANLPGSLAERLFEDMPGTADEEEMGNEGQEGQG